MTRWTRYNQSKYINQVEIIKKSHLVQSLHDESEDIVVSRLCEDMGSMQSRTEHSVLSHSISSNPRMYVGGMGGTGKTRVLNALTSYFCHQGESKWLIAVAPTGTAAALVKGLTLKSFMVCTGETKSGLAWTHTKPTLNPTNTHTPISISVEGSKEFNSTCTLTVSQQISRALSQWPDATRSNQQYLKFSLFLLWSFLQESMEYHATLKAKTFINLYKRTHRSAKMTQSTQWAH